MLVNPHSCLDEIHFAGAKLRINSQKKPKKRIIFIVNDADYQISQFDEYSKAIKECKGEVSTVKGLTCGYQNDNCTKSILYYSQTYRKVSTIDCLLAAHLSTSPYIMVALSTEGVQNKPKHLSYGLDGSSIEFFTSYEQAYERLFGSSMIHPDSHLSINLLNNRILKLIEKKSVDSLDKFSVQTIEKFNHFKSSFEEHQKTERLKLLMSDDIRKFSPKCLDSEMKRSSSEKIKSQFDMCASILKSGLSQVVTLHVNSDCDQELIFEQISNLGSELSGVQTEQGTMFDDTCIVYTYNSPISNEANHMAPPFLLLGNFSNTFKTGKILDYENKRSVDHLYSTFLHAVDYKSTKSTKPEKLFVETMSELESYSPLEEVLK